LGTTNVFELLGVPVAEDRYARLFGIVKLGELGNGPQRLVKDLRGRLLRVLSVFFVKIITTPIG
jgi:hypothetical protein